MNATAPFNVCGTSIGDDLVVVTVWSFLLLYGLLSNAFIIIAIWRNNSLRNSTSYWLIASLAFCDCIMIIISITHLVPATLFHEKFVQITETRNYISLFMYNIFWYIEVLELGGMAINRCISIVFPMSYPRLFSRSQTYWILVFLHAGGFAIALPAAFPCCRTIYNHHCYLTQFMSDSADGFYGHLDYIVNSIVVLVMILCYGAILWRVRQARLSTARHRNRNHVLAAAKNIPGRVGKYAQAIANREMRLFIQFFVVSIVFTLTFVTWQIAFRLPYSSKWLNFAMTLLFFINNATNPTVYLLFNHVLRGEMRNVVFTCCPRLQLKIMDHDSDPTKRNHQDQKRKGDDGASVNLLKPPDNTPEVERRSNMELNSTHV